MDVHALLHGFADMTRQIEAPVSVATQKRTYCRNSRLWLNDFCSVVLKCGDGLAVQARRKSGLFDDARWMRIELAPAPTPNTVICNPQTARCCML